MNFGIMIVHVLHHLQLASRYKLSWQKCNFTLIVGKQLNCFRFRIGVHSTKCNALEVDTVGPLYLNCLIKSQMNNLGVSLVSRIFLRKHPALNSPGSMNHMLDDELHSTACSTYYTVVVCYKGSISAEFCGKQSHEIWPRTKNNIWPYM